MILRLWNSGSALTAFPKELADRERDMIAARRKEAGVKENEPVVGLAISGGGIRSATFGLGVLQALAKADVLKRVDYLSTVSGGGYIGAFLGRLYTRGKENEINALGPDSGETTAEKVAALLCDRDSKPNRWLRENGRYLTPNGAGDIIAGTAVAVRNFFSVHLVMAFLFLPMALGLATLNCSVAFCVKLPCMGVLFKDGGGLWTLAVWLIAAAAVVAAAYWLLVIIIDLKGRLSCLDRLRRTFLPCCCSFHETDGEKSAPWLDWGRRKLTSALGMLLLLAAAVAFLGILDLMATQLLGCIAQGGRMFGLSFAAVSAFLFGTGPKIVKTIRDMSGPVMSLGMEVVGLIAGIVLLVLYVFLYLLAAEAIMKHCCCSICTIMWVCAGVLLFLILLRLCSKKITFLSDSSFAPLYQARLARAYLGATNPEHFVGLDRSVTEPKPHDDTDMDGYLPHEYGGPLHLVNVTLNETITANNTEHRDRKGVGLCRGPAGVSVGVRHHALFQKGTDSGQVLEGIHAGNDQFQVFPARHIDCESMKLGRWVALSGAAISTGLGANNSLGMSLLFGISNMRLGHWWNSGVERFSPRDLCQNPFGVWREWVSRIVLPLHTFLLDEWLGRFHGTASRYWYLSDGGHYENTATYELIRRRLPYIIVCNDGCDPNYQYADLGNLVRKARMDFGAEVEILSEKDDRERFLAEHRQALRPRKKGPASLVSDDFGRQKDINRETPASKNADDIQPAHALLARITYEDGSKSLMIVLKPSLTGDEPADIRQYAEEHASFPNESTGDQVFDEAQWESYRELGYHVANRVFGDKGAILT